LKIQRSGEIRESGKSQVIILSGKYQEILLKMLEIAKNAGKINVTKEEKKLYLM